jgi:hypothetical protein
LDENETHETQSISDKENTYGIPVYIQIWVILSPQHW